MVKSLSPPPPFLLKEEEGGPFSSWQPFFKVHGGKENPFFFPLFFGQRKGRAADALLFFRPIPPQATQWLGRASPFLFPISIGRNPAFAFFFPRWLGMTGVSFSFFFLFSPPAGKRADLTLFRGLPRLVTGQKEVGKWRG